jgi:hypothetical protein
MTYEVHDDLIDQIWRDLAQQVPRPRVVEVAHEVANDLGDVRVPGYVPLFVRRLACERLTQEAEQRQRQSTPAAQEDGHAG